MKLTQDIYPVFEANQVLSDLHLNEIFNYLDEQDRLTRANLIGIGIVCGLEISLDVTGEGSTVRLTRGCGVTSEGYLIVEPQDAALVSYRIYTLPNEPDYSSFKDQSSAGKQFDLWELFPAGEPDPTTPLDTPAGFISDKAVLLFLELKKEGLRNCSPNNCDDKGAKITATVRRLLIKVEDLAKVIAAANQLGGSLTTTDLQAALLARLNLADVRLPRYDAPNTSPSTSRDVLAGFLALFRAGKLALQTGTALTAAYDAFKPIVEAAYPSNPFAGFAAKFGFLDNTPTTTAQVRFLPYYLDFFDDLLKAYDEFRWKGAELLCACCPSEGLFPRHLMLGALAPDSVAHASLYRHPFLASPAVGDCADRTKDVRLHFQRLVEMIAQFSNQPKLPDIKSRVADPQIRITPSRIGDVPLSDRAIPYYYKQEGTPPLYRLWNADKSRRDRAHHNLSYRSDEYTPTSPAFVTEALRYDLEPYNFLRIEGHLGKDYQSVLNTLLAQKTTYRLPIEIIALRAGAFDEDIFVDLKKEECRFQDLETLYDALREELVSALCEGVMYLYGASLDKTVAALVGGTPNLPLLKQYAPNFRYGDSTVGAWYEKYLALLQGRPYIDVDQTNVDQNAVLTVYCILFAGTTDLPQKNFAHVVSIYYLTKLAEVLPASLDALGFLDFQNKYQDLMGLIRFFRSEAVNNISAEFKNFIPQEDLIDHFDEVLFSSKLEPIRAIHEEYVRRLREVKQKQFLSVFLRDHPGIQHKAGVPLGGTFILVYHEEPIRLQKNLDLKSIKGEIAPLTRISRKVTAPEKVISEVLARMGARKEYADDPDVRLLFGALTGQVPDFKTPRGPVPDADKIIDTAVGELADGTVIADFYLPYLCCSGCPSVQFVLPKIPPTFTVEIGCTDPGTNMAEATVTPKGGEGPYSYKLEEADVFLPLTGKLVLPAGAHTLVLQDSAGTESAPQSLTVPEPLTIEKEQYIDNAETKTYQVRFPISGGRDPYKAETGTVAGSTFTSLPVPSGEATTVSIIDSVGCKVAGEFKHIVCDLPCDGVSRRCAYRLWLQPPVGEARYETYRQEGEAVTFRFNGADIVLPGTNAILQADTAQLNDSFENAIAAIVKKLNSVLNQALVGALGPQGKNRLVVGYKPAKSDPFGVLWIEHFVCETFSIEFSFSFGKPSPVFSLTWRYTNEKDAAGAPFTGAIMVNRRLNNKETRIPVLDCSERNQCAGSDYANLCQGPVPKLKFDIVPRDNNSFGLQGDVGNIPAGDIVAWVWDVSARSSEPLYEGKQVVVGLERPEGVVRLTAVTNKGCFAVAQRNIQQ